MDRKELKSLAKSKLKDNRGAFALAFLIIVVLSRMITLMIRLCSRERRDVSFLSIYIILSLVVCFCFCLLPIIQMGLNKMSLDVLNGEKSSYNGIFGSANLLGKYIITTIWIILRTIHWIILVFVGSFFTALGFVMITSNVNPGFGTVHFIAGGAVYIGSFIMWLIKGLQYSRAYFIVIDNTEITEKEAIKESQKMMKGHVGELFILEISFLGWYILSIFTLGILEIFHVGPYRQLTNAAFYKKVAEQKILEN